MDWNSLVATVNELKEMVRNYEYQFRNSVTSEFKRRERTDIQPDDLLGLQIGLVVDTVDPLKQGRVRFYTPYLDENVTDKEGLPWAAPVSTLGGFDDSGSIWVPPAGSKIVFFFHHGDRNAAYYMGTTWYRHRGPDGNHLPKWDNYPVPEYDCLWDGKRNGYLVGDQTGDQVFPQWNTEMYNGYDNDSITDFYSDPSQYGNITYPYIKGFKTEEKHYLKFVEGDPKCNRRWKRLELCSSRTNCIIMKDDHLHPAGQWAFGQGGGTCHDPNGVPLENPCCDNDANPSVSSACAPRQCFPKQCPASGSSNTSQQKFVNPYYKRQEEMRPYQGANTPQANACTLEQSGIHMQSVSGHQVVLDDKVNQPTGVPTWDRTFDFGCDDTYRGKMFMKSATGHLIEISDQEEIGQSKVRGENNYIRHKTALGNFFDMNDHTLPAGPCTPKIAGAQRGFTMMSTSTHLFQMNDEKLEQDNIPIRREGGVPKKADKDGFKGYILLRSGYGLQLLMKDKDRQDKTKHQFILLEAPQKDNTTRGPHLLVMQEEPEGPGEVMLRAGGVLYVDSYDDSFEVVGSAANPSNKMSAISKDHIVDVKDMYFAHNNLTIYFSETYIFLLAGRDCPIPNSSNAGAIAKAANNGKTPCIYNVIVSKDPWKCPLTQFVHFGMGTDKSTGQVHDSRSMRVYASADDN